MKFLHFLLFSLFSLVFSAPEIATLLFALTAVISTASEMQLLNSFKDYCRRLTSGPVSCTELTEKAIAAIQESGTQISSDDIIRITNLARQSDVMNARNALRTSGTRIWGRGRAVEPNPTAVDPIALISESAIE